MTHTGGSKTREWDRDDLWKNDDANVQKGFKKESLEKYSLMNQLFEQFEESYIGDPIEEIEAMIFGPNGEFDEDTALEFLQNLSTEIDLEESGVEYDTTPTEGGFTAIGRPDSFDAMP